MSEKEIETDPTKRFSNRVTHYVSYRPRYPEALLSCLEEELHLTPGAAPVADIGSGTGFLSELFLRHGYTVYGVEPNAEMRAAGEMLLRDQPGFVSVDGTAEATTLADDSAGLVVAGQAFHWFDADRARVEFHRILRSGGAIALIWNERKADATPLMQEYEALLSGSNVEYVRVRHQNVDEEAIRSFFAPASFRARSFDNAQTFDFEGLRGRLLSSSYAPLPGDPAYPEAMRALQDLFQRYQEAGVVTFLYDTRVYFGEAEG